MIGTPAPSSVALVNSAEAQRIGLCNRLERRGYVPALFATASELLGSLANGKRFKILVMVEDETSAWSRLSAACSVLGIPALLLTQELQWRAHAAPEHDFLPTPLCDFATLGSHDIELDTRMRTLIQRARREEHGAESGPDVSIGDYVFLEDAQVVLHRGREIQLQPRQFDLALELFRNVGRVVTREWLWNSFWGSEPPRDGARALDVCVANVRRKLDLCPENGFTLRAVYKRGYQLRAVTSRAQSQPDATTASARPREAQATFSVSSSDHGFAAAAG